MKNVEFLFTKSELNIIRKHALIISNMKNKNLENSSNYLEGIPKEELKLWELAKQYAQKTFQNPQETGINFQTHFFGLYDIESRKMPHLENAPISQIVKYYDSRFR